MKNKKTRATIETGSQTIDVMTVHGNSIKHGKWVAWTNITQRKPEFITYPATVEYYSSAREADESHLKWVALVRLLGYPEVLKDRPYDKQMEGVA